MIERMRKELSCLMFMAMVLAFAFTGCSKDSDPTPAQDIVNEYKGDMLLVKSAGEVVPGGTMKIEAIDNTNAKVTLLSVVNGQPSFEMAVPVVQSATGYQFEGKKDMDGMKVAVKGIITEGVAAVDVAVEITAKEILGSWAFNSSFEAPSIVFDLETKSGDLMYFADNGEPVKMNAKEYSGGVQMMAGMMLGGFLTDFSFNFQSDGYVGIKGVSKFTSQEGEEVNIPKLARYYYNPATKTLMFDAPLGGLLGNVPGMQALSGTMQVPFQCKLEDGILVATLDKALLSTLFQLIPAGLDIDSMLAMLDGVIPEAFADLLPWIKGNIKTIFVAVTDKNDFKALSLGARLIPVKQN